LNSSENRGEFLRFIVEETLAGRANLLKGSTIAVEVYGRDESFDGTTDPVVRLEGRRLRRDLDSYYMEAGASDPIRISIPKGAYIPHFEWREGGAGTEPGESREQRVDIASTASHGAGINRGGLFSRRTLTGAAVVTVLFAVLVMLWNPFENRGHPIMVAEPEVLVLPFQGSSDDKLVDDLAYGITFDVIDDLMRFQGFRVFAPFGDPVLLESKFFHRVSTDKVPGYVVNGNVDVQGDRVHVTTRLSTLATQEVVWSNHWTLELSPTAIVDLQRDIANMIATEIGQPYGIVASGSSKESPLPKVNNLPSYMCVQRAFIYRRSFSKDQFRPVLTCLEHAVRQDPQYSDAWAMLGWLYLDAGRFDYIEVDDLRDQYRKAFDAASKALALDPVNTTALKSLSSINHYMGHFDEAEHLAQRALEINPNDPDTMAQYGWRLAARGNFDEGIPLLEKAIELSLNPPNWYYLLISVHQVMQNDYQGVMETTRWSLKQRGAIALVLRAIASARLERPDETREALQRLEEFDLLVKDPMAYLQRHGFADDLSQQLVSELEQARASVTPMGRTSTSSGQH
jgi:TolB-like protein